ncbi:hypothetical protein ACXYMX_16370 [Sporosarcina sp. CAU 1771]
MIMYHVVLDENRDTMKIVKNLLERDDGMITVVDSRYEGMENRDGVIYTNIEFVMDNLDLPAKYYFHAYMDPRKRKR